MLETRPQCLTQGYIPAEPYNDPVPPDLTRMILVAYDMWASSDYFALLVGLQIYESVCPI
jgi:hypothetical protein